MKNDTSFESQPGSDTNKIVTSRPRRSTRGNHRVPLSEFQIPEIQPKAHKAYDNLARRNTKTQPDLTKLQTLEKIFLL